MIYIFKPRSYGSYRAMGSGLLTGRVMLHMRAGCFGERMTHVSGNYGEIIFWVNLRIRGESVANPWKPPP